MTPRGRWLIAAVVSGALASCGGTQVKQIFVLSQPAPVSPGVTSNVGVPVIAVMAVRIPDYLDTTDMLRDSGPQQMTVMTTGRWGERLSIGITDAITAGLTEHVPSVRFAATQTAAPARALVVEITSLHITMAGACALQARWQVLSADGSTVLASDQGNFQTPGADGSVAAMAASLEAAVTQLTAAIATTLPHADTGRATIRG